MCYMCNMALKSTYTTDFRAYRIYSTYSTYSKELGESGCSAAWRVRYSTYSTYSKGSAAWRVRYSTYSTYSKEPRDCGGSAAWRGRNVNTSGTCVPLVLKLSLLEGVSQMDYLSLEGDSQMVYILPERLLALVRPAFDLVLQRIRSLKRCVQARARARHIAADHAARRHSALKAVPSRYRQPKEQRLPGVSV